MRSTIFRNLSLIVLSLILPVFAWCGVDDFFRSTGKIYVVVASLVLIFLGIVLFLVYLERRIKRLEQQQKHYERKKE